MARQKKIKEKPRHCCICGCLLDEDEVDGCKRCYIDLITDLGKKGDWPWRGI